MTEFKYITQTYRNEIQCLMELAHQQKRIADALEQIVKRDER